MAESTRLMAERLESIARNADPRRNLYLNHQRAELTEAELRVVKDPETRARGLYLLAPELLLSGRTEEAIDTLLELERFHAQKRPRDQRLWGAIQELLGLSYLRLGEQQNCLHNHTANSCVLPIREEAQHRLADGSRQAIARFAGILEQDPDNSSARWLLNLAHMTLGSYPRGVEPRWTVPEATLRSEKDIGRFVDQAGSLGVAVEGLAGGVAVEDFDRDGDLDLVCSSWGLRDPIRVFRNEAGRFIEQSTAAGLGGIVGGLNLVHADYDNDGRDDVMILRGGWWGEEGRHPNSLLRNESDGETLRFRDVTEEAGLESLHPTQTAAWADVDGDGWLDLFIGNESTQGVSHPAELFVNNRDGTFTERAAEAGLALTEFIKGVAWGDVNNDGAPDLYLSILGAPNRLFLNETRNNTLRFVDVTRSAGVSEPLASFPTWFFDYDNDGWLDLFVSGYAAARGPHGVDYMELEHRGESPRLYRNRGDGRFEDVTQRTGLDRLALTMGSGFGDLDNDGFLDFYLGTGEPDLRALTPNRMYLNEAGRRFADITFSGGFGHLQKGHGVAFADFDHDGDQDVYEVMGGAYSGDVYRNVLFDNPGHGNGWIAIVLEGGKSNRSAIGTRLRLVVDSPKGERTIHRVVSTGGSFGSTSLRQHVGLGGARSVERLEIDWAGSGGHQVFVDLPANRLIRIREGVSSIDVVPIEPIPWRLSAPGEDS